MADDFNPAEFDSFKNEFDPSALNKTEAPKQDFSWSRAITDIPTEIGKEFSSAVGDVTALGKRSEMGPIEGPLATGKAVLAPLRAAFSPFVGTARSTIGHTMANVEHKLGEYINPEVAKKDNPEEMYEKAKGDVDLALSAARPRAPTVPRVPEPPPIDKFGVTLTEGERTGNLAARQAEQAALRGQAGAPAQAHAEEFFNQQRPQQLEQARRDVSRELDPLGRQELAQSPEEAADIAQRSLQREFGRSKQGVRSRYQEAKDLGGDISTAFFDNFTYNIKNDLTNRPGGGIIVNERTPRAADMIDYLNDRIGRLRIRNDADPLNPMGAENGTITVHGPQGNLIRARPQGVTLEGVEEWRKTLSEMRGDALKNAHTNARDATASQAVLDEFDRQVNSAVNSGAFNGPREAIQAWNDARAAHAAHMRKFGNDAVGKRLREIIGGGRFDDPASLDTVANHLFGSGGGRFPEINIAMAKRLKNIFGENSPEWAAIRQGMLHRVVSTAQNVADRGPGTIANRLGNFVNSDMSKVLMNSAQRQLLNEYAELHRTLSVPSQGANWPNTAAGIIPHIKKATGHILGAIGAAIGHAVSPIVGGAVGFGLGEGVGFMLRGAENSKNLRRTASQLPLVGQRLRQWQQANFNASTKASVANDARKAIATNQLALALERIGMGHEAALRLLASGPSGTGPSEAGENKRIEVPVYKENEGRAAGGRVQNFDVGGVPTFDERFAGTSPDNPSADDMVDNVVARANARDNIAPNTDWAEKEAQSNLALQQSDQPWTLSGAWEGMKDAAKRFSQYDQQFTSDVLNFPRRAYEHSDDLKKGVKNLLGMGDEERYQLWPEKMVRSGATLPHDVMTGEVPQYEIDPKTGEWVTSQEMIHRTQDLAGMAGSGGLGAGTTDATLGSAPFLRPALKYEGKIYKAPMGGQHLDAIPKEIYPEFQRQAMSGEDISNFNFGFMNHKGHFLDRESALDYAVKEGLIDPRDANQGALTTTLLSDSSVPGAPLSALSKQPFYSAAEEAVKGASQQKMHGTQWANWLKNQPGVKPDELEWTGLDKWLRSQDKPVTKQQVEQYLDENKVEVKDVVKYNNRAEIQKRIEELENSEAARENREGPELDEYNRLIKERNLDTTKYYNWQLPGGENYKEHLLTLPSRNKVKERIDELENQINELYKKKDPRQPGFASAEDGIRFGQLTQERNTLIKQENEQSAQDFKSSHWDEPNVLVHMRTNEREVAGKPSYHIEEIQSDWHQAGRKQGYRQPPKDLKKEGWSVKQDPDYPGDYLVFNQNGEIATGQLHNTRIGAERELTSMQERQGKVGVPDAPFKTAWPELALKRMIRMAAEEGKTRISWTPGEAQAARYNLAKQIDELRAYDNGDGTYRLIGIPKSGHTFHEFGREIPKEKLVDYVGKDVAEKLLNAPEQKMAGGNFHELKGQELKVGGEGMKGFYDNMLPKMVEKLGKKYGVKVKESKIWPEGEMAPEHFRMTDSEGGFPVKYFDIPEKMKEEVLSKGFPLFSDTSHGAAVAGNDKDRVSRPRRHQKDETEVNVPARASGGRVVASNINHVPTEAQKSAGNYSKDHVFIQGLDITIENAKGHTRSGTSKDGKKWSVKLPAHYGYVKRTEGADGDHIDVYLGPHIKSKHVFVVNQVDAESKDFDEHKAILGVSTLRQALDIYAHGFSDGKGLQRIGSIVPTTMGAFKDWLKSGKTSKPYALN